VRRRVRRRVRWVGAVDHRGRPGGERASSFPAADGPTTGVVLGRGRTGVVLGHQAGSDLCEWLPRARVLAKQGRQVLAFDFGPSGKIGEDMVAAAAELHRRGAHRLVLLGSSMGGTAAIAAAAEVTPPVAGVISLSDPEEYQGKDAAVAAPRLRMPALFVAARDDPPSTMPPRPFTTPSPQFLEENLDAAGWCGPGDPPSPGAGGTRAQGPYR
jgi:hypothetical protein